VICGQRFTGQMQLVLAETRWSNVQILDDAGVRAGVSLAKALTGQGRYAESETTCRELLAVAERGARADSDLVNVVTRALCDALFAQNKTVEAEAAVAGEVSKLRPLRGPQKTATLNRLMHLEKMAAQEFLSFDDSLAITRGVRDLQQIELGANHATPMSSTLRIAVKLNDNSRYQEAETDLRELLNVQQRVLGAEHPTTLLTDHTLCEALLGQHKFGEAERRCREVLAGRLRVLGAGHPHTILTQEMLSARMQAP
jgi:hypothetical protein